MIAWNWGGQILYTCKGCNALGFNIERAGIKMEDFMVEEVLEGHECRGCSKTVEKRDAPNVEFYTCSECNVGLFVNVHDVEKLELDKDDPESCANHNEMRAMVGQAYERLIKNLR
jgi:hypothetical protein